MRRLQLLKLYKKSVWQDNICIKLDGSRKFDETAVTKCVLWDKGLGTMKDGVTETTVTGGGTKQAPSI